MLLAVVLGIMLAVTGQVLIRQWLSGALVDARLAPALPASAFPRLAPPASRSRPRAVAARPTFVLRRAA